MLIALLCLSVFGLAADAKSRARRRTHARADTITVTGCVSEGVECLILTTLDGKHKYSLGRSDRLKPGRSYRIRGTVGGVSVCMQGESLKPVKITPLKLHCPVAQSQ
jgi:hypothetical protein